VAREKEGIPAASVHTHTLEKFVSCKKERKDERERELLVDVVARPF
jgi:hypothetical protein